MSHLQQYKKIIKIPTLQTYFSLTFIKIEAYSKSKKKNVSSLRFRLKVFIWRHVVYVLKSSTALRGILICVIYTLTDMQEYFFMSSIALE
jgi:hypothetical protein